MSGGDVALLLAVCCGASAGAVACDAEYDGGIDADRVDDESDNEENE
jgi:hypothetical protein